MTDKDRIVDLLDKMPKRSFGHAMHIEIANWLVANGATMQKRVRPLEEWGEDYGDVLWWAFPIEEPPYVGSPLDLSWPGYHTHWTSLEVPELPKNAKMDLEE